MRIFLKIFAGLLTLFLPALALAQTSTTQLTVVPSGTGTYVGGAGLAQAIHDANTTYAATPTSIVLLAGSYNLSAAMPPEAITRENLTIAGQGRGTQVVVPCSGFTGRVFTLKGNFLDIRNMTIAFLSCASFTDAPIGVESGHDFNISNILMLSPPGMAVLGTDTTAPQRITFRDVQGFNWTTASGVSGISIKQAQSVFFENILLNGADTCAAATRAVNIAPVGLTDTVVFRRVSIFDSNANAANVCARNVTIDFSKASIAHIWMDDCVFDSVNTHSIEILNSGSTATSALDLKFRNCSLNAQAGGNSVFISLTNSSALLQTVEFDHNAMVTRGKPAVVLDSMSTGTARTMSFHGNDMTSATAGWTGAGYAVELGMDNSSFIGNNNVAAEASPTSHPGSVFFKTTKSVGNTIIQGNFSTVATALTDTSMGTISPAAGTSGNIP